MFAHSTLVLPKTTRSARHPSHELAARANSLALRARPLHCHDRYLSDSRISSRLAGWISFRNCCSSIRTNLTGTCGLGRFLRIIITSLQPRGAILELCGNFSASFTCRHPNNLITWPTHRGKGFGFSFGTVISHTSARIWRG